MKSENSGGEKEVLAEGKFVRFVRKGRWEYCESVASGAAAILGVTDEGEVLLVEQFRPAVGRRVIELPAGIVGDHEADPGEESIEAARRELLEETGYAAGEMRFLGSGPSSAGITAEIVDLFFASKLEKEHEGGGVGSEDIAVHAVPWKEVREWLAARRSEGEVVDLRVYSAFEMAEMEGLLTR